MRRCVPWLVGVVCAFALVAMLLSAQHRPAHEVRAWVPQKARPGETLPVRVVVFGELQRSEGPRLVQATGAAVLRRPSGEVVAQAPLRPGMGPSLEGGLPIPEHIRGTLALALEVVPGQAAPVSFETLVNVNPLAEGIPSEGRPLRAMQALTHGPLLQGDGQGQGTTGELVAARALQHTPPLQVVVGGGACVPELPCTVFVASPGPVLDLAFTDIRGAELKARTLFNGPLAVLRQTLVVHGPEATAWVGRRGTDRVRVRMHVRLAVQLGQEGALEGPALPREDGGNAAFLTLNGVPGPCLVDGFVAGHWVGTGSVQRCDRPFAPPFGDPGGVLRLQVRRGLWPGGAGAVWVGVLPWPGEPDEDGAFRALLQQARAPLMATFPREGEKLLSGLVTEASPSTRAAVAPYLAAMLEVHWLPLPPLRLDARDDRPTERRRVALLAAAAVGLAGGALVWWIGRGGARAARESLSLLAAAGTTAARIRRLRRARTWVLALSLGALLLMFSVICLYLWVRSAAR